VKTALVIMAAGLGSRYGGIKQLEPVGPGGEIIMDYSIYDAIEAGFNKVVFIIRKDLEQDFKEVIGNRIEKKIEVEYVFQDIDDLPEGYTKPEGRTKPWGTGQAVLSCLGVLTEPFAVINADDYYGKQAFVTIHDYLMNVNKDAGVYDICMAGFILGNTLSENGTVTRGVCKVDDNGMLVNITETSGIMREGLNAAAKDTFGNTIEIDINSVVSMNLWGFTPDFLVELEKGFTKFLDGIKGNELKAEYLLPEVVGKLVKEEKAKVHVLKTSDIWFGVTYKEDKEKVVESFQALVDKGVYPSKLF
jgi:NDP-sugar pyrophosphorylase family protein